MRSAALVFTLSWLAVAGVAQEVAPPAPIAPIVVQVRTKVAGEKAPRVDRDGKECPGVMWRGRELEWRIGDGAPLRTPKALARALAVKAKDPATRLPDPRAPGEQILPPVEVDLGDDVRWAEVLAIWDAVHGAGFDAFRFAGLKAPASIAVEAQAVDDPVVGGGALVVPKCEFHRSLPFPWQLGQPTFDVFEDGHIVCRTFSGEPDVFDDLRRSLAHLRGILKKKTGVPSSLPLIVRADKWARWSDVRQLIEVAAAPEFGNRTFWLAVTELEYEGSR
ncbi:MAG: hypothetical protein KDE27_29745 [Planctomycetes bacterium]|nr:hypothetical protein [Planctomycetota bacterium]